MTIDNDINSLYPSMMIYAPYTPLQEIKIDMKWRTYLGLLEVMRDKGIDKINELMQEQYPGPYRVVENYDKERMVFGFKLEFDDPKKEMLWKINNG